MISSISYFLESLVVNANKARRLVLKRARNDEFGENWIENGNYLISIFCSNLHNCGGYI